jgi:tripartite ATP-independent transporter DctM subunit
MSILLAYEIWNEVTGFLIVAVPLFIFMSEILVAAEISVDVYKGVSPVLERLPGGLLHSNLGVCAILAATTGSLLTGAAAVGTIALPELKKRNYDPALTAGTLAIGGTLGTMIPPSITMIILGALVGISVGKLFIAGIIPGLMLVALYMSYVLVRALLQPGIAPRGEPKPWGPSLFGLLKIWPAILLVVVVLGSIYAGIATPTESASLGCVLSLLIALGYRRLSWKVLKSAALKAFRSTSVVFLIFVGAKMMAVPLSNMGVFLRMAEWVLALPLQPIGILIGIYILYIILGMFLSGLPMVVITLPLVWPILTGLGYDPIFLGVAIVMLAECGAITPPVGLVLYLVHGMAGDWSFATVAKGTVQFALMLLIGLAILTAFPNLALILPNAMGF